MKPTRHATGGAAAVALALPIPASTAAKSSMRVRAGVGTIGELYRTLVENGRWWMFPMIVILGLTSLLLIAIAAIEYVAPFVYTIF